MSTVLLRQELTSAVRPALITAVIALGVAVLSAIIVSQLGSIAPSDVDPTSAQAAYQQVFMIAFWVAVVAAGLALFLPGPRRAREHRELRRAELTPLPAEM